MEQSLTDRGDGEELIDTKLGGVHSTDSRLQPSSSSFWYGHRPADYAINFKSWTDPWTHLEKSFADRGDGEDVLEKKLGGVHSMDSRLQPSQMCLQLVIWTRVHKKDGRKVSHYVNAVYNVQRSLDSLLHNSCPNALYWQCPQGTLLLVYLPSVS